MKRSSLQFPVVDSEGFLSSLEFMWKEGWFDEFSSNHFLIQVLENRLSNLPWLTQLLSNNSRSIYSPINPNGTINYKNFTTNFLYNFAQRMQSMLNAFGKEEMEKFVIDQLSAGKDKYDENQFFEALSEIEILSFFSSRGKWDNIVYEPPTGPNASNPEASFEKQQGESSSIKLNIEVKTPNFVLKKSDNSNLLIPCVMLTDEGRNQIDALCKEYDVTYIAPRVTKLVDFINSAAKKFQEPKNGELNLLYINWSYSEYPINSFIEAWRILTNQDNGIMVHPSFGQQLPFKQPILKEAYEKISAIIVYTSSLEQLMFNDFSYVWQGTDEAIGKRFRVLLLDKNISPQTLFSCIQMNPSDPLRDTMKVLANLNQDEFTRFVPFIPKFETIITSNVLKVE